jgi:hypothetical protein
VPTMPSTLEMLMMLPPPALALHLVITLAAGENCFEVRVDDLRNFFVAERRRGSIRRHACVIDETIEPAVFVFDILHYFSHARLVCNIRFFEDYLLFCSPFAVCEVSSRTVNDIHPASANAIATPLPIPRVAPVMSTVFCAMVQTYLCAHGVNALFRYLRLTRAEARLILWHENHFSYINNCSDNNSVGCSENHQEAARRQLAQRPRHGPRNIEFAASGKYKRTYSEGEAPAEKGKWTLQQGKVTIKKANGKLVGKYVLIDSKRARTRGQDDSP